jgi:hypothetical protein
MRDFNDADRKKKKARVQIPENPSNLSEEKLSRLADGVKASLRDGNLPCGAAFKIAAEMDVPRIAVGAMTDKLGVRVSNCQIGCFKVDKNIHEVRHLEEDDSIASMLETLGNSGQLTCVNVHALAAELRMTPMAVADVASRRDMRIRQCQLGCF